MHGVENQASRTAPRASGGSRARPGDGLRRCSALKLATVASMSCGESVQQDNTKVFELLEAPRPTEIFKDPNMSEKSKLDFHQLQTHQDEPIPNKLWCDRLELDQETIFEPKIIGSRRVEDLQQPPQDPRVSPFTNLQNPNQPTSFLPTKTFFFDSFSCHSSNGTSEPNPVPIFYGTDEFLTQNHISADRQAEISRYLPIPPLPTYQTPSNLLSTNLHDNYRLPTLPNNNSTQNFTTKDPFCAENDLLLDANSHTTPFLPSFHRGATCEACSSLLNAFDRVLFRLYYLIPIKSIALAFSFNRLKRAHV